MNKLVKAAKEGRLYNGYIICAREISLALQCAKDIGEAVKTTPYIVTEPNMDNIRQLQRSLLQDMENGGGKVAIIYGDKMSERCQNAMLKTIEEHRENVAIIIIVTNVAVILPTIISRCVVYYPGAASESHLLEITGGNLLAARYAMGSEEKAREIMEQPELLKEREEAVQIMERLREGIPTYIKKENKDLVKSYIMYILLFLRDALTKDIHWFFDKKDLVLSYINSFTTEEIISMIKEAMAAESKINKNTNPILAFSSVQIAVLEVINGNGNRG